MVAGLIVVRVYQAVAVAVVTGIRVRARAIVVRRIWVIIAGRAVRAACCFKLIADAVLIRIVQAVAVAVVIRLGIIAVARIGGCCVVVACC